MELDISEGKSEEHTKDKEGKQISYNPPQYVFHYDFNVIIRVNHPYFDTIKLRLNQSSVCINDDNALPVAKKPNERSNRDYIQYEKMVMRSEIY